MSARCAFTLLVVVALSLLLASGSALSRPSSVREHPLVTTGQIWTQGNDEPDEPGAGGMTPGDDDVWDKPVPGDVDSKTVDVPGVDGRTYVTFSSERPGERSARMAIWLRLLLRNWLFFVGAR